MDLLTEKIANGSFAVGSHLPSERQLCQMFAVSRTVIREAIKALESRGMVRIERGRGTLVQEFQTAPLSNALRELVMRRQPDIQDLLELRKVLELYMVERAARRRTTANLQAMEGFLRKMEQMPGLPEGYVSADVEFHMEIARSTQNPVLLSLLEPVSELLRESRLRSFSGVKMVKLRVAQHREIFDCIRRKDANGAREVMAGHLAGTERDLKRRKAAGKKSPVKKRPDGKYRSRMPGQGRTALG
jgi:GntR family transcriptional repressor for pyruvate dehydrogenase complex